MDDGCAEDHADKYANDVDAMLDQKGCSAVQYFKSATEKTHAPLLEFVTRSIEEIGNAFAEKAEEDAKQDIEDGLDIPEEPTVDDDAIESQLVDIKKDTEYEDFIDQLKRKTVKKIVSDISKLISDKKDEGEMTFSPKTESAFVQGMEYITETMMRHQIQENPMTSNLMELAVRESTIFAINECFNMTDRNNLPNFHKALNLDKGLILTESAVINACTDHTGAAGV